MKVNIEALQQAAESQQAEQQQIAHKQAAERAARILKEKEAVQRVLARIGVEVSLEELPF